MDKDNCRIFWVDYIKGICMMAIILNHLYGPNIYGRLTYPFELVGFFFVAGYTYTIKDNFHCFLRGKVQRLLIPFVIFGVINSALSYYAKGGSFFSRIIGLVVQKPGEWDFLWFVACLFITELIFYPIARFVSSSIIKFLICLTLFICGFVLLTKLSYALPWHIENACIMIIFLCVGHIIRKSTFVSKQMAEIKMNNTKWIIFLMSVAYLLIVFAINNYPIDIHLHQYGQFTIFMISAWFGLGAVLSLSLLLERRKKSLFVRFWGYVGTNTLVYYAFQSDVIQALTILGDKIGFYSWTYVGSVTYCILTCIILVVPSYLIKQYTPFMLGRF